MSNEGRFIEHGGGTLGAAVAVLVCRVDRELSGHAGSDGLRQALDGGVRHGQCSRDNGEAVRRLQGWDARLSLPVQRDC